jgi:hypothetical protein
MNEPRTESGVTLRGGRGNQAEADGISSNPTVKITPTLKSNQIYKDKPGTISFF